MATATDIVDQFGGSAALARATGFPLTTIEGWKSANYVPEWRQAAVIDAGRKADPAIRLTLADFPSKADRRNRPSPQVEKAAAA